MASTKAYKVGFKSAVVYALDEDGYPAAAGVTAYGGVAVTAPQALTLTRPQPRRFVHPGGDRVMQVDALPPTDVPEGTLRTGVTNLDLNALLESTLVHSVEGFRLHARATDRQGYEPVVGILAYAQARDTNGARYYRGVIIPKATVTPGGSEFDQDSVDPNNYTLVPSLVSAHLWGAALTEEDDGCTETQWVDFICRYPPVLDAFKQGGGAATEFDLSEEAAADTGCIAVWLNGELQTITTHYTVATTDGVTTITFVTAPSENDVITVFYERAV